VRESSRAPQPKPAMLISYVVNRFVVLSSLARAASAHEASQDNLSSSLFRFVGIRASQLHIFSIAPSTLRPWFAKNAFLPCASLASTRPPRMNFPQHRYHSRKKNFLRFFPSSIHGTNMRPCIFRSLLRTPVCATSLSFPRSSRVRLRIEWTENLTTFQPSNTTLQSTACITPPQGA